jgi:hypothetical protein
MRPARSETSGSGEYPDTRFWGGSSVNCRPFQAGITPAKFEGSEIVEGGKGVRCGGTVITVGISFQHLRLKFHKAAETESAYWMYSSRRFSPDVTFSLTVDGRETLKQGNLLRRLGQLVRKDSSPPSNFFENEYVSCPVISALPWCVEIIRFTPIEWPLCA